MLVCVFHPARGQKSKGRLLFRPLPLVCEICICCAPLFRARACGGPRRWQADTMIYADQMLVGQVVVNLLKNAREAVGTRRDACIEITSRIDPQENVVIEISNNGGAIPAEVTENIFTPFFTTKPDGSGIGLSVSRRIMQLHNGSLRLTANTDNRVTFTLLFG